MSDFYHDLTSFTCFADARSETVYSEPKRAEYTITYATTTTTQVEEQKSTDVRKVGKSTVSSRTPSGVQSSFQGGVRRRASSTHSPAVTEAGWSPNISSASKAVESRRSTEVPNPTNNSALEKLLEIQRLHREEKDCMLDFVRPDYEDYKRSYEEQFEAFRTENERLTRELSASTSQVTVLQRDLTSISSQIGDKLRELHCLQDQLQDKVSGKDCHPASPLSQAEEWKRSGVDELSSVRQSDFAQLRRDLAT
jgi:hypothetical protein